MRVHLPYDAQFQSNTSPIFPRVSNNTIEAPASSLLTWSAQIMAQAIQELATEKRKW